MFNKEDETRLKDAFSVISTVMVSLQTVIIAIQLIM